MRVLLALALVALGGCAATAPRPAASPDLVVSAAELADGIEGAVVVHVARERADYDAGHVPGARFLPLSAVAAERGGVPNMLPPLAEVRAAFQAVGVSDGSRVVLYGDLGGLSAARALYALDAIGHPGGAVLDGGLAAWQRAGQPVSTDAAPPARAGSITTAPDPRVTATASDVRALLDDAAAGRAALVDARPFEQYTGATPGGGVTRPGHVPGAASLFWEEDLRPDGTLRSLDELRARYAEAGAVPGEPVVTYCRTGVQASHAYLVARLLGLQPRLYDGSFFEWSTQTDYPVQPGPQP
ncbi:sulfurtransferase [Rubricoccus marinus]|uniref:Rhodanese domain-containing protein n=1 Tax=Rubricoccus marinus TaxID=716817 RepID=A0A259TUV1_9BACT|nr:sulfurtransferase [Rubricoccus marinus]OZC01407.1 hypothetical protein BSZ36_17120 [Rubricoccus marinus]